MIGPAPLLIARALGVAVEGGARILVRGGFLSFESVVVFLRLQQIPSVPNALPLSLLVVSDLRLAVTGYGGRSQSEGSGQGLVKWLVILRLGVGVAFWLGVGVALPKVFFLVL